MSKIEIKYKHFADRTRLLPVTPEPVNSEYSTQVIDEDNYRILRFDYRNVYSGEVMEKYDFAYRAETKEAYVVYWSEYTLELIGTETTLQLMYEAAKVGDIRIKYFEDNTTHICDKSKDEYFTIQKNRLSGSALYRITVTYRVRNEELNKTDVNQVAQPYRLVVSNIKNTTDGSIFKDFYDFQSKHGKYFELNTIFPQTNITEATAEKTNISNVQTNLSGIGKRQINTLLFGTESEAVDLNLYANIANSVFFEDYNNKNTILQEITVQNNNEIVTNGDDLDSSDFLIGQSIIVNNNLNKIADISESLLNGVTILLENNETNGNYSEYSQYDIYQQLEGATPNIDEKFKDFWQMELIITHYVSSTFNTY